VRRDGCEVRFWRLVGFGRKLWEFLPYFSEITYSLPLSVATVNQTLYDGLSSNLRDAVDSAGSQTETALWLALSTRLQETISA
jgi:TRAP-type C4-dicarboxylate transport system substrate-binding protein